MGKNPEPIPIAVILLFGPVCVLAGAVILAAVLGYIPMAASRHPVPAWWIWVCGLVFLCSGLWLLLVRIARRLAGAFGVTALLSFVLIFNWIAFGPGERHFTSKTSTTIGMRTTQDVSETEGRIVFGIFAGAIDLLIAYSVVLSLRKRLISAASLSGDR